VENQENSTEKLAIISCHGIRYLGVIQKTEESTAAFLNYGIVQLYAPLMFQEVPQQQANGISFSLITKKLVDTLGLLSSVDFRPEWVVLVSEDCIKCRQMEGICPDCQQIHRVYEDALSQIKAQDSGLVSPTNDDVISINRNRE